MKNFRHVLAYLSCLCVVGAPALLQSQTPAPGQMAHETLPVAKTDPNQPGPVVPQPDDQEGTVDEGFALKRMQWFTQQRAYPNAHIPVGARWNALQQHEALRSAAAARFAGGAHPEDAFTSPAWISVGPQPLNSTPPYSGRATSIAIDPNTPTILYLGTAAGGVWKSTDSGTTWKPLTDPQASLAIGALAIDPSNTSVIYAGTGEPDYSIDSYYGQGLLKSTNGGATWTLIRTPFTSGVTASDFTQIALQPGNSSVVVASTLGGVYRSADAGATWTRVLSLAATSVIFDKTTSSVLYAGINCAYSGTSATAAVYKSTDAGVTWTPVPGTAANLLPAATAVLRTTLTQDSSGANLYAAIANSSYTGPGSLYKSTDGGNNWTKLGNPTSTDVSDWYRDGIAVVPNTNPNVLFVGGVSIWQSVDGGVTWAVDNKGGYYSDQHAFVASPDGSKVYVADDGGISVTATPATANPVFTSLNSGISTSTFYPGFSILASQPNSALAGTQDHGLDLYTGSLAWAYGDNDRFCGDGGGAYVDPQNSHAYAHCQGGSANWVANASGANSVTTYVGAQAGINTADRWPWVADIKGDPENIAIVYTGTNKLYQSTNYAGLWTAISPDLTAGSSTISTIGVSPTNSNVVYTGASDGTFAVTTNALSGAAATWTKPTGLPGRAISKIIVAPDSPQDVYVAVSGFGTGHLFNSTNGGSTWTDLSGNLPNTPLNSFLLDPALINTIYAATDTGVYYTTNRGSTWAILGTGLPNVVVQDILMYPATRQIRVITHGRGAWDVTIAAAGFTASTPALSFASQTVGTSSTAQTVTLANNFAIAVPIGSIVATGNFTQTNNCGASLASGATCTVSVVFSPLSVGAIVGTLQINSTTGNLAVNLSGTGAAPAVGLSVGTVGFANQLVNTTSAAQTVVLTNSGTASLAISSLAIAGANAADFAQTNTCGSTVAAQATCNIVVTFTPTAGGSRVASISIADNATGSPHTVGLAGTGIIPVVTALPVSLTFGPIPPGLQTAAQTVTLTNSGTAAATISSIAVGGSNAAQFTQTNNCGSTLNIGSSCTVTATFTASAVGSAAATISIADNSANSPQTVSLSGTSIAPFTLSTSGSTASVAAGATATYTVQLAAATGYPLSAAVQVSCAGAPSRATCTVAPTSVAAGATSQSITVTVATTATTTGRLETNPLHRGESLVTFAALLGVFCLGFRLRSGRTRNSLFLLLVVASGTVLLIGGCGGNKSGPTTVPGTPSGTYTLTVTAQGTAYQATQNLSLTVQ